MILTMKRMVKQSRKNMFAPSEGVNVYPAVAFGEDFDPGSILGFGARRGSSYLET